jgi:predicted enzyme related to lactoylglutathione lyase
MRSVVFDFAPEVHDAAKDFWQLALCADARRGHKCPEYHVLEHPAAAGPVMVQCLGEGQSRVHVDIETDDPDAEVRRLLEAGAAIVQKHEEWAVLRDPAGLLFCVVPADGEDFARLSHPVG